MTAATTETPATLKTVRRNTKRFAAIFAQATSAKSSSCLTGTRAKWAFTPIADPQECIASPAVGDHAMTLDPEIALLADQACVWLFNLAQAAHVTGRRLTTALDLHLRSVADQGRLFRHAARRDGMPLIGRTA